MASLIRVKKIGIEGEIHFCGDLCVCDVRFDEVDQMNYHKLDFDKDATAYDFGYDGDFLWVDVN